MRAATRSRISVAALLLLTAAVYIRPSVFLGDQTLEGLDYFQLHFRRISFARDALLGQQHFLPAWYPKELMGTPFAANIQSFPWIPTRLLLLVIANARLHYALAVLIAACLSAVFTYLFARRSGLSEIASVAAGWTFACAGFFASRVYAGHLPLLEAYPALPLLLWLIERSCARVRDLVVIAAAAACSALAGHPQLPAYALGMAGLYALYRKRGQERWRTIAALALGVGATLVVWWPMLLLIGRSSRVLHLYAPDNDVSIPFRRLLALVWPDIDGWPTILDANSEFSGPYPNEAWFWDTASYVGVLPLIGLVWLGVRKIRAAGEGAWDTSAFFVTTGLAALFLALPLSDSLHRLIPIVLFRSPARLLYVCTFVIALALGYAIDQLRRYRAGLFLLPFILLAHAIDLGRFDYRFVRPVSWKEKVTPPVALPASGRVAIAGLPPWSAMSEDAGGFDSIILADTYEGMLRLGGDDPKENVESFDASSLPQNALEKLGVQLVFTSDERVHRLADTAPRASVTGGVARYSRLSSDRIDLATSSNESGVLRIVESFDPGWAAAIDGVPARVQKMDGFLMGVTVPAGRHLVSMRYETPGRELGWLLSALDLVLLAGLLISAGRRLGDRRSEQSAAVPR